jgi:hypothetical protein
MFLVIRFNNINEVLQMPTRKIHFLDTNDDGSVDTLILNNATSALLKVLSIIYKMKFVELSSNIFIDGRKVYLTHQFDGDEAQLIATDWLDILEQKLYAITFNIHEKPDNPNLAVFDEVGMSIAEHDDIVSTIHDCRPLFNKLGLRLARDDRKIQLSPVKDLVAKQPPIKEYRSCIAAVCTHIAQPYAEFFYYNSKGELQQYYDKYSLIQVNLSHTDAIKLDDIRSAQRLKTEDTILIIKVMEAKSGARKYDLLSYDFLGQNQDLDLR